MENRGWKSQDEHIEMQICQQWEGGAYSETFEDTTGDVRSGMTSCLCERLAWPHRVKLLTLTALPAPCPIPARISIGPMMESVRTVYVYTALSPPF